MKSTTADRLSFDVTRCKYAEMYRALGLADLGASLSCVRDFALVEGFNPAITLERTQTLMQGAPHCDFRFRTAEASCAARSPEICWKSAVRSGLIVGTDLGPDVGPGDQVGGRGGGA